MALLLGCKNKYQEYFDNNPGTFFKSSGWIERDVKPNDTEGSVMKQLGIDKTYEEYIELFGEENAAFLAEILLRGHIIATRNYRDVRQLSNVQRFSKKVHSKNPILC